MRKLMIALLLLATLVLAGYSCLDTHESRSLEQTEFFIEKPYMVVVKGLATKNSLEKIVEENDGAVTNKDWDNFTVEVPQRILRLREYKLEGLLKFTVKKNDRSLGRLELPFIQEIHLDDQVFSLRTSLASPQKQIPKYEKIVEISPVLEEGGPMHGTHVSIKSELVVRKTIPFFFRKMMDERVGQANKKDMEQLKNNIMSASANKTSINFIKNR